MEENSPPEVRVIADKLRARYSRYLSYPDVAMEDGEAIWDALIDYWKERGNVKTDEPIKVEEVLAAVDDDFPGAEFCDGAYGGTFPTPYIHGGEARSYEFPSTKTEPDDDGITDADKISMYEEFALCNAHEVSESLWCLASLPIWTNKEKKKIMKFATKLTEMVAEHD